jgi:hypothetical protein
MGFIVSSPTEERFYWIVTADPVAMTTSGGSGMARAACSIDEEGLHGERVVPQDWQPPVTR